MYKRLLAFISLTALISGCFTSTPRLHTHLEAVSFLNPNVNNRPAPVVVTIFELKSATAFQQANFFALYNNPTGTLGGDLLDKHEIEVRPKQKLDFQHNLATDTNYIGVTAAFRNPARAHWRRVIPVRPGSSVKLQINLSAQMLSAKLA